MLDKVKLGRRYACYECGTKFYDMNRPAATCPECGADQANAPVRDIRSILSSGKGRPVEDEEEEEEDLGFGDDYDEGEADDADDDDDMGGEDEDDDMMGEMDGDE